MSQPTVMFTINASFFTNNADYHLTCIGLNDGAFPYQVQNVPLNTWLDGMINGWASINTIIFLEFEITNDLGFPPQYVKISMRAPVNGDIGRAAINSEGVSLSIFTPSTTEVPNFYFTIEPTLTVNLGETYADWDKPKGPFSGARPAFGNPLYLDPDPPAPITTWPPSETGGTGGGSGISGSSAGDGAPGDGNGSSAG